MDLLAGTSMYYLYHFISTMCMYITYQFATFSILFGCSAHFALLKTWCDGSPNWVSVQSCGTSKMKCQTKLSNVAVWICLSVRHPAWNMPGCLCTFMWQPWRYLFQFRLEDLEFGFMSLSSIEKHMICHDISDIRFQSDDHMPRVVELGPSKVERHELRSSISDSHVSPRASPTSQSV